MRLTDGRAIPTFSPQALRDEPLTVYGDGSQTRSFTYVSDLIDGIWKLSERAGERPRQLGNPRELTLLEWPTDSEDHGSKSENVYRLCPSTIPRCAARLGRARRLLKWEPTLAVEEGLRQTIEWYRRPGPDRLQKGDSSMIARSCAPSWHARPAR